MIRKLLIANRGEIACRIMRTCKAMGIATVAVYSDTDVGALHVEMADEAVHIGASPATDSYLNSKTIIEAAKRTNADAIHPGYGFLAENADFAQAVFDAGFTWVGPNAETIAAMGNKKTAKNLLEGIPYVAGYTGDEQSDERLTHEADAIGYPVMVKAAAGGGGKGMRLVDSVGEMASALAAARREAHQAFGDDTLMLEKAIVAPRHIEVQIIGDQHGTVIALGERECSIQRRHQKIIEESPAYGLSAETRQQLHQTAVNIGTQLGYVNAGTVEFLLDADEKFYFIEMNTRLQVEHPVTEAVYAVDLVRWQLEIAQGSSLYDLLPPFTEPDMFGFVPDGHAVEVRIYAEDPYNDFLPVTGDVLLWDAPDGVRVDSGVRTGDSISTYYDPMLAKVIAHGRTRTEAIRKLDYALSKLVFFGLRNNIRFLRDVITHDEHVAGKISTNFIDQHPDLLNETQHTTDVALIAAAIAKSGGAMDWRNNRNRPVQQTFKLGDDDYEVSLTATGHQQTIVRLQHSEHQVIVHHQVEDMYDLSIDGHRQTVCVMCHDDVWWVHTQAGTYQLVWKNPLPVPTLADVGSGSLRAPMPGQVIAVHVAVGQAVEQGDVLMILEAMKMEHRIVAPTSGTIETIQHDEGDAVQQDAILLAIAADELSS